MWNSQVIIMLLEGIRDTLYMTLASTLFGYIIGLPMGIVLTVTDKDGIRPNAALYKVLDVISNLLRSIPFIECHWSFLLHTHQPDGALAHSVRRGTDSRT